MPVRVTYHLAPDLSPKPRDTFHPFPPPNKLKPGFPSPHLHSNPTKPPCKQRLKRVSCEGLKCLCRVFVGEVSGGVPGSYVEQGVGRFFNALTLPSPRGIYDDEKAWGGNGELFLFFVRGEGLIFGGNNLYVWYLYNFFTNTRLVNPFREIQNPPPKTSMPGLPMHASFLFPPLFLPHMNYNLKLSKSLLFVRTTALKRLNMFVSRGRGFLFFSKQGSVTREKDRRSR